MALNLNRLTATKVKNAKVGMHADGGLLYLLVRASKTDETDLRRSWVFRYRDRVSGKLRDMGLGPTWDVSLVKAREKAATYRQMLRDGKDPMVEKQAERTERRLREERRVPFDKCCELYIKAHRASWKNPKHAAQWESTLATYCKPIWTLPVDVIDTALVMKCLEEIWGTKTETASRLRGRMESVLAWATVRKLRTGENPARWRNHLDQLLAKPSKTKRVENRPAMPYGQIAEFMVDLRQHEGDGARALELQVLTACRPGEVAGAQWSEFDLDGAVWTIPGERMKAGKEHRVPLSKPAVRLLRGLERIDAFVFHGLRGGCLNTEGPELVLKGMHVEAIAKGLPGYVDPVQGKPAVPHGLRSTFRDWAGETTSYPREVIEHALAHRLKDKAEAAYQRGDLFQKRARLMQDWAAYCATVLQGNNVTALRREAGDKPA